MFLTYGIFIGRRMVQTAPTAAADTNGVDSVDIIASGYDVDTDSTFAYASLTKGHYTF